MGNIQLLISYKCCSSDEIELDDNEYKEIEKPKLLNQLPTIPAEDNINKLVTISDDSFTTQSFKTTIPCNFPN